MNQAIAGIVKDYIDDLTFVDKIAGLVSTQYMTIDGVQKSYPVACCVTADDCIAGAYDDLAPDSKYKTVIYFEDGGVSHVRDQGNFKYFLSRLRLVCWINVAKLNSDTCYTDSPCSASTNIIIEILRNIPEFPTEHDPFHQVKFDVVNQVVRSNSIFSQYTYNEKQVQYLMSPYDYFALEIETSFAICIDSRQTYTVCT